jgi:hypothetical protein
MRWLSVVLAGATLLCATSPGRRADAFVTPGFSNSRERGRKALLGTWRALSYKSHNGAPVIEPPITVVFERSSMRVEAEGVVERGTWRVVDQEGDMLELQVTDSKGKTHDVDVLVEGTDALTLYIEDDDGDDDGVLRVERSD